MENEQNLYYHDHGDGHVHAHEAEPEHAHSHAHTHSHEGEHIHHHDHTQTKTVVNRLSRAMPGSSSRTISSTASPAWRAATTHWRN